jgi:DNA-binding NarL/FixJ family response regulator
VSSVESNADLIGDLYEAALNDDLWPQFARILATAAGAPTSAVWIVDRGQVCDLSVTADGIETDLPYRRHFWKLDPWQRRVLQPPFELVRLGYEIVPEHELVKTEFYNDFAKKFGLFRPMATTFSLAPGIFATASLERPGAKALFEEQDKGSFERLAPHVKRALQLRLRQRESGLQSAAATAALDELDFGVIICDRAAKIVFANKASEALAAARAGVLLRNMRVMAHLANEAEGLAALISDAAGGVGGAMRLTGAHDAQLLVMASPLPHPLRQEHGPGCALLALRQIESGPRISADALMALFRFSPAQAALCVALVEGRSLKEIAAERGVKLTTLRSHAQEAMLRAGVKSLRDLVRLIGSLPPLR